MNKGRIVPRGNHPAEVFSHAAELRAIGVDSPRVTRISNSLAREGVIEPGAPCLNVAQGAGASSPTWSKAPAPGAQTPSRGASAVGSVPSAPTPARPAAPTGPSQSRRRRARGTAPQRFFRLSYGRSRRTGCGYHRLPRRARGRRGAKRRRQDHGHQAHHGALKAQHRHRDRRRARHLHRAHEPDRAACGHALPRSRPAASAATTVLDEVAFGLELAGIDVSEARRRAQPVIERSPCACPPTRPPFSAFAWAATDGRAGKRRRDIEPEVIILDEPTSGLDYRECMTVMETVSDMAEAGSAVIMVCHDMESRERFRRATRGHGGRTRARARRGRIRSSLTPSSCKPPAWSRRRLSSCRMRSRRVCRPHLKERSRWRTSSPARRS